MAKFKVGDRVVVTYPPRFEGCEGTILEVPAKISSNYDYILLLDGDKTPSAFNHDELKAFVAEPVRPATISRSLKDRVKIIEARATSADAVLKALAYEAEDVNGYVISVTVNMSGEDEWSGFLYYGVGADD